MAILETSFIIDVMRKSAPALELFEKLEETEPALLITTPSIMELWEGALQSRTQEEEKNNVNEFINLMTTLPLDTQSAKLAAEIMTQARQKGDVITPKDAMIAGISMTNGETLITKDSDYTRIRGLRVLKY